MPTNIAILSSPGISHLSPLLEFAKRLVAYHNDIFVTFIVPTNGPLSIAQKAILDSLPPNITSVILPPVSLDAKEETIFGLTLRKSLPALREVMKSLAVDGDKRVAALVVDLFGTDAIDVAKEFNVSPYIFFASNAMSLSFFFHLPKLHETVSCEYWELKEPVRVPGWNITVHGKDLVDPVQDRSSVAYEMLLHTTKSYKLAEGVMVNSFKQLEPGPIGFFESTGFFPPVYPVGPLVNMGNSSGKTESECLTWLDKQPHGSVLYVSFGSGGTLTSEQFTELAFGLERSEQRFLWVIRCPNDKSAYVNISSVESQKDPFNFLPEGFLERTQGKGLVVPSWAPQAQVLSHGSTSGFLTHCGWNSTLESIVNGVPLIAWPLYAEQKMNAIMLTEDVKVALRPKVDENGLVGRDEIENIVRTLMEGEEGRRVRNTMKELKDAAFKALSKDGSSTKALSQLIHKWKA